MYSTPVLEISGFYIQRMKSHVTRLSLGYVLEKHKIRDNATNSYFKIQIPESYGSNFFKSPLKMVSYYLQSLAEFSREIPFKTPKCSILCARFARKNAEGSYYFSKVFKK